MSIDTFIRVRPALCWETEQRCIAVKSEKQINFERERRLHHITDDCSSLVSTAADITEEQSGSVVEQIQYECFESDFIISETQTNQQTFRRVFQPKIEECVRDGINQIFVVSGQSGTGKSHTIIGDSNNNNNNKGVLYSLMKWLDHSANVESFNVQCIQIYGYQNKDNINKYDLFLKENDSDVPWLDRSLITNMKNITRLKISEEDPDRDIDDLYLMIQQRIKNNSFRVPCGYLQNSNRGHLLYIININRKFGENKQCKFILCDTSGMNTISIIGPEYQNDVSQEIVKLRIMESYLVDQELKSLISWMIQFTSKQQTNSVEISSMKNNSIIGKTLEHLFFLSSVSSSSSSSSLMNTNHNPTMIKVSTTNKWKNTTKLNSLICISPSVSQKEYTKQSLIIHQSLQSLSEIKDDECGFVEIEDTPISLSLCVKGISNVLKTHKYHTTELCQFIEDRLLIKQSVKQQSIQKWKDEYDAIKQRIDHHIGIEDNILDNIISDTLSQVEKLELLHLTDAHKLEEKLGKMIINLKLLETKEDELSELVNIIKQQCKITNPLQDTLIRSASYLLPLLFDDDSTVQSKKNMIEQHQNTNNQDKTNLRNYIQEFSKKYQRNLMDVNGGGAGSSSSSSTDIHQRWERESIEYEDIMKWYTQRTWEDMNQQNKIEHLKRKIANLEDEIQMNHNKQTTDMLLNVLSFISEDFIAVAIGTFIGFVLYVLVSQYPDLLDFLTLKDYF